LPIKVFDKLSYRNECPSSCKTNQCSCIHRVSTKWHCANFGEL